MIWLVSLLVVAVLVAAAMGVRNWLSGGLPPDDESDDDWMDRQ